MTVKVVIITPHALQHLYEEGQRHNYKVLKGIPSSMQLEKISNSKEADQIELVYSDGDYSDEAYVKALQEPIYPILEHDLDVAPDIPKGETIKCRCPPRCGCGHHKSIVETPRGEVT
ncbi:hypothetical protein LCGC14_2991700 [marine sediment metagenome]|uniref:Uncharacterized protein n=1 Tax=marine sediment metagenome TaxID=412755 RepID=A0A0F8XR70_9ZZZZ